MFFGVAIEAAGAASEAVCGRAFSASRIRANSISSRWLPLWRYAASQPMVMFRDEKMNGTEQREACSLYLSIRVGGRESRAELPENSIRSPVR